MKATEFIAEVGKEVCMEASKDPEKALATAAVVATTVGEVAVAFLPAVLPVAAVAAAGFGLFKWITSD